MTELTNLSKIFKAFTFAAEKISKQRIKDPEQTPYINPIGVADIIIREGKVEDIDILQATILQDTIEVEDTETQIQDSIKELELNFGVKVAVIVQELSDDKTIKEIRRIKIENASTKSYEVQLVRMAEKIYNLRDLNRVTPEGWTEERVNEYFKWAEDIATQYYDTNPFLKKILKNIFKEKEDKDKKDKERLEIHENVDHLHQ